MYCFKFGCFILHMSTRLKVSVSAFRYLLHNLCVSVRPFFLSVSMSRTVLKSPLAIIKV